EREHRDLAGRSGANARLPVAALHRYDRGDLRGDPEGRDLQLHRLGGRRRLHPPRRRHGDEPRTLRLVGIDGRARRRLRLESSCGVATIACQLAVELTPETIERLVELDRKFAREGLTFDDVLLVPAESAVLPNEVSTATRLTRKISLEIPIVSAAMDTVTEGRLAIALAREGGLGILHRNLSIEDQVAEVDKVKRSESGMIVEPVTLP